MQTYGLKEALDFFFYLLDEEDKEALTKIWLAKEIDQPLGDFIKKYSKKSYIKRMDSAGGRRQSVEEDKKALALAESILNLGRGKEVRLGGNL